MTTYAESKKKIEEIRNRHEVMFRMSVSHLMDVGFRHLTKDNIDRTCAEIMQEDDGNHVMTNEFKCDLVKTAGELARIDHIHLLVYISREVDYDVFDGAIGYTRAMVLLRYCMAEIEQNYCCNNEEVLDAFENIGFDDDELEVLGYGYLLNGEEES